MCCVVLITGVSFSVLYVCVGLVQEFVFCFSVVFDVSIPKIVKLNDIAL